MFCPMCAGVVCIVRGRCDGVAASIAVCAECSMVSEVVEGALVDLAGILLEDLYQPFFEPPLFEQRMSLHGRRDS